MADRAQLPILDIYADVYNLPGGIIEKPTELLGPASVAELIDPTNKIEPGELVQELELDPVTTSAILNTLIHQTETDSLIWRAAPDGKFSLRSAYRFLLDNSNVESASS